jgi:Ca2+-binding RTX toxin-like protein
LNGASNTQLTSVEVVSAADAASAVTIDLNRQNDGFTMTGSSWSDVLTGSSGSDVIAGGAGNDTIKGGAGADVIYGGDGADVFVFSRVTDSGMSATTRDSIMDFVSSNQNPDMHDVIDLSEIDAIQGGSNQAFSFNDVPWNGVGAQFTGAGQLSYQFVTDESGEARTIISGNVNSNLGADFQIALMGHVILSTNDFIL